MRAQLLVLAKYYWQPAAVVAQHCETEETKGTKKFDPGTHRCDLTFDSRLGQLAAEIRVLMTPVHPRSEISVVFESKLALLPVHVAVAGPRSVGCRTCRQLQHAVGVRRVHPHLVARLPADLQPGVIPKVIRQAVCIGSSIPVQRSSGLSLL